MNTEHFNERFNDNTLMNADTLMNTDHFNGHWTL